MKDTFEENKLNILFFITIIFIIFFSFFGGVLWVVRKIS
jgi:hypothetical protein